MRGKPSYNCCCGQDERVIRWLPEQNAPRAMNEQAAIVPPSRPPWKQTTRRVMRRRKARLFAQIGIWCAVLWALGNVHLWSLSLSAQKPTQIESTPSSGLVSFLRSLSFDEATQSHRAGIAIGMLCIAATVSGVTAVVLRFTEQPRETLVQETVGPPFEPPVIHARLK